MSTTQVAYVKVDGLDVFYRYAGDSRKPVILLLHGFPSSSFGFRNLIPLLAKSYRVIAPDLPGFGFTVVPSSRGYVYTFANIAATISAFLDELKIEEFAVYIFDYGAPVALRIALERPQAIKALITQNGNAYEEGFGKDFWAPIRQFWESGNSAEWRKIIADAALTPESVKSQYTIGHPNPTAIPPETFHLDYALSTRPGFVDINLDFLYDYQSNRPLYPKFQDFLRSGVPVLAAWGKNDAIFVAPGAEAYRKDVKEDKFELHLLDTGHFAIENHEELMAGLILDFLQKYDF